MANHLSYGSLDLSASSGCGLCTLFRDSLLDDYAHRLGYSNQKAIQRELQIDKERAEKTDLPMSPFVVQAVPGLPVKHDRRVALQTGHLLFGFTYERKSASAEKEESASVFVTACPGHGK